MNLRDVCKQKAKDLALVSQSACPAQIRAWNEYKTLRNQVNNRKKYEEREFKTAKMGEVADNPDLVWKSAKSFMGWKKQGTPTQINTGSKLVTSAKLIAQTMNEFFLNKVQTIRAGMQPVACDMDKVHEVMVNKRCQMKFKHVTVSKVKKILKSLSNSRSTGIDELDNFSVKLSADFIAQPVHHIITLSIMQNKFPSGWKYSKVLPLHKKEDPLDRKNYRPVAILSPLSKVLEKIVYEQKEHRLCDA